MFKNLFFQFITIFNFFSFTYVLILLFIFGYLEIVSEAFLILSLITIFTQGFSSNIRNIYLGSLDFFIQKKIRFRILIGILGFFLSAIASYIFIGKSYIFLYSSLIFLSVTNWILELLHAKNEKKKHLNIYIIINIFFFLISSFFFIYLKKIIFLTLIIYIFAFLNIFIYKNYFIYFRLQRFSLKNLKFDLGTFSTFLKSTVNFCSRYFIIIFIGKLDASLLFVGFILGSFFGTLFDISYGALFFKNVNNKNFFLKTFYVIYVILVLGFVYFVKKFSFYNNEQFNLFFISTLFSVLGSYFAILSLHQRQLLFEKPLNRQICYKADTYIYLFNFLCVPFLYYLDRDYLLMTYLVNSLLFYVIYVIIVKNVIQKKNS